MEYICDDVASGSATAMSSSDIMGMDVVAAASTALAVAGPIPFKSTRGAKHAASQFFS